MPDLAYPEARRVVMPLRHTSRRHFRGHWRRGLRCQQRWTSTGRTYLDDLPPTDPHLARLPVCERCAALGPPGPDP